jgi:II/X family phage/plasmid replication protein
MFERRLLMFIDWVSCYQDFEFELPIISDDGYAHFDFIDGAFGKVRQSRIKHEGSFSTSVSIHVQGNRIVVEGNPSRFGRLDNLFGFTELDHCFTVYNHILSSLGLPLFTKCTKVGYIDDMNGKAPKLIADGAVLTRLDITTNMTVGAGNCVDTYLKALSMLPYRRSRGHLFADGKTVDWQSILGNARHIYPCVYDKGHELTIHLLPKVKKAFGNQSPEYEYIKNLINYCKTQGVTRHEQKIKSEYLKKTVCNIGAYQITNT